MPVSAGAAERLLTLLNAARNRTIPNLDVDAVRDLLPNVDLDYADAKYSFGWLHQLTLAIPGEDQLAVAEAICEQVKTRASHGCLYRKSKAENDPMNYAARQQTSSENDQSFFVRLVKLLLDTDQELDNKYGSNKEGAQADLMISAAIGGSEQLVQYLGERFGWHQGSEAGRLAEVKTAGGCSLPQVAATNGHKRLLEWFNKPGTWHFVRLNIEDNDGETALTDAAREGHDEIVRYLINQGGCRIDHRSRLGDTPLFRALRYDKFTVAGFLLDNGADPGLRDYAGNSTVHAALQTPENTIKTDNKEYLEILKLLRKNLKRMNLENLAGYNPLHACVESKNWTALEAALELQLLGEPALVSSSGLSVLHVFFSFHSSQEDRQALERILGPELWTMLLKQRQSHGHKGGDRAGYSCLHFACDFNNRGSFDYLVRVAGFRFYDRTATGNSAIDLLLRRYNFKKVKKIFQKFSDKGSGTTEHLQLCALVDPVRAASARPAATSQKRLARRLLRLCADELERGELMRFPTAGLTSFKSGRLSLAKAGAESVKIPLGAKLLMRCVNEDHSEGVRSLAVLGLLDGMWDASFMGDVNIYWKQDIGELKNIKCRCDPPPKKSCTEAEACAIGDLIEFCHRHNRHGVCLELLRYRQFDLVPTCLRLIIRCNEEIAAKTTDAGKSRTLQRQRDSARDILLNSLNYLDDQVSEVEAKLVESYLEGRIDGGPRFQEFGHEDGGPEFTVLQLLEKSDVEEAFATYCIKRLVDRAWTGHPDGCAQICHIRFSSRVKFALHIVTYLVFTVCFAVFITMGETCYSLKTTTGRALYAILAQFCIDFVVMHSVAFSTDRRKPDVYRVAKQTANLLGPVFLLAGLIGVPIVEFVPEFQGSREMQYGVYMCLATAYLLMLFRWLKFFKWLDIFGPTVGIIERLLVYDLLPFLLIFLVFVLAFGVFFQVLLYPGRQVFEFVTNGTQAMSVLDVIVGIYSKPLLLTFGEIEIDSLRQCVNGKGCSSLTGTDCTCPYSEGIRPYLALFGFIFLILNLALLNLLIAKFNLTVNTGVRRAFITWSCYRYELLREFQRLPPAPPPYCWVSGLVRQCLNRRSDRVEDSSGWWRNAHRTIAGQQQLPSEYTEFLWLQAQKFRDRRSEFQQPPQLPDDQS